MSRRAQVLADRLQQGAQALAAFVESLSEVEWRMKVPKDGRMVGVIVHHVASVYPLEIQLAQGVAGGQPVAAVGKPEALELLRRNSRVAADAVRAFSDEKLDRAAPVSLNGDAPLTAQFLIEDHAQRHSFHHLAGIRTTVGH